MGGIDHDRQDFHVIAGLLGDQESNEIWLIDRHRNESRVGRVARKVGRRPWRIKTARVQGGGKDGVFGGKRTGHASGSVA